MIKNPPIIKKVIEEMGGTIERVIPERGYFFINLRGRKIFVSRKFKISSNLIAGGEITRYKDLTYFLLKKSGLPSPKTVGFYKKNSSASELTKKLNTLQFPIVIKDAKGSNSKGVFVNIKTIEEAKKVIARESQKYSSLIAQEMVFGREYRILVLKNNIIGALEMIPPRIFGDGKKTVQMLISEKQKKTPKKTKLDEKLIQTLKKQGVTLKSILAKGQEIFIKQNSCLAEGGETRDVTDLVHADIKKICIKSLVATGKYLGGIDVMCSDISKNLTSQDFNIIEINGKPDLYIHYNPTHGKTRNVIKDIINFILAFKNVCSPM